MRLMPRHGLDAGLRCRWAPLAAVLLLATALVTPALGGFFDSLNPFVDTKDEFEGRFADTLEPGPWETPLARLAAERAVRDAEAGNRPRFGRRSEEGDSFDAPAARLEPRPPPDPIPDGITLLRIGEDSVAHAPAWEDYLNGIGLRLIVGSPVTGVPLHYYVTASEDYPAAKAYPDGAIGIPLGLLRQVDSEDELAFVLGHEAAHVVLGHHDSDWFQSINQNMVSAAEMALVLGVAVSQKLGKGDLAEKATKFVLIAGAALFVADKGLFPSFTREQEDEADLLGLDLMVRGGYNAQGAFDAFAKIQVWEAALAERADLQQDEKRVEMEREIAQSAEGGAIGQAVEGVLKLFTFEAEEVGEKFGVSHRSAVAREESLIEYFLREYAEVVPPDSSALQLETIRNSPEGQELFGSYGSARRAMALIDEGELKEAEQLARKAVAGNFNNDSLTRYAFFQTRLRQGKFDKARRNLELALEGPRPTLAVYRELADIHWAQGKRKQAIGVLEAAFETFQKPPELYADLIYRHYQMGDKKKANEMAVKCKFRNRGAGEVCGRAAKGESPKLAKGNRGASEKGQKKNP
jgi:predicted Zn-dependent protease